MTLSSRHLGILIPLAMAVGIWAGVITGWWQTENSREPIRFTETDFDGAFAGMANPADIRGSYSLADIEAAFALPVADMVRAFGLVDVADPELFQLKQFEELELTTDGGLELGTDSMRLFVARYLGLPYDAEETTGLPETAVMVLLEREGLDAAVAQDIQTRSMGPVVLAADGEITSAAEDHAEEDEAYLVRGTTTFGEVLAWGVDADVIESITGLPPGPRGTSVRDWAAEHGLSFSTLRTELQQAVDIAVQ